MNIILTSGILLIIVSLVTKKKYKPYIGFAFVFLIMGFQSGVEGDFMEYMQEYNEAVSSTGMESRTIEEEPVFPYLMKFFGFFAPYWLFILLMSLLECFVLEKFVSRYAKGPYQFISAILFFFAFNMMLLQMKALRQGFAIELMVASFLLLERKKKKFPWGPLLLAIMSFFTHNSSLVAVPFLILFFFATRREQFLTKWGNGNLFPVIMVGVYMFVYFIKTTILNDYLIGFAMLSDDSRFSGYLSDREMENAFNISWLIVLYDAIIIFIVAWYYRFADSCMRVFCWASMIAAIGDMLVFGIGSLPRIIMYLVVFNMAVYPSVAQQLSRKFGKIWALAFLVLLVGYAIKTSLPWMLETVDGRFGTYRFVFMP